MKYSWLFSSPFFCFFWKNGAHWDEEKRKKSIETNNESDFKGKTLFFEASEKVKISNKKMWKKFLLGIFKVHPKKQYSNQYSNETHSCFPFFSQSRLLRKSQIIKKIKKKLRNIIKNHQKRSKRNFFNKFSTHFDLNVKLCFARTNQDQFLLSISAEKGKHA